MTQDEISIRQDLEVLSIQEIKLAIKRLEELFGSRLPRHKPGMSKSRLIDLLVKGMIEKKEQAKRNGSLPELQTKAILLNNKHVPGSKTDIPWYLIPNNKNIN